MRRIVIFVLVLILSGVCLRALDSGQKADKNSDLTTLQGCLQMSNSRYLLTEDNNGATHLLSGAATKLGHQVGREIEVTGKPAIKTLDSTIAGAGSSAVEQEVFEVKSVKRIADVCK
ncbi:MAG: hypothetical protein WA655_02295 [Candidatus Korobacteraceae bacterium]